MPFSKGIRRRRFFVDRLSPSEVGVFVGRSPDNIKKRFNHLGSVSETGRHVWTVAQACKVFISVSGRKPRGEEISNLLERMGADTEEAEGMVLKLWVQDLSEHKTIHGYLPGRDK